MPTNQSPLSFVVEFSFFFLLLFRKLSSDAGRSASPTSETGIVSDEKGNGKGRANLKGLSDLLRDLVMNNAVL